jgi:thymidylate synthase
MSRFHTINEAQIEILEMILQRGREVSPRGVRTLEIPFVNFSIESPRARLLTIPGRRWSLPMAVGELCWHLSGSDTASEMAYYAKRWMTFADERGRIEGSCYGRTIFGAQNAHGENQWHAVTNLLKADSDTRRAVLFMNVAPSRLALRVPDVACASSLQFLLREGRLDAIVTMRSNDAILGFPYDVFFFSMLQELMACQLGVELGRYYHSAGSMHIYERHIDLAKGMIGATELGDAGTISPTMPTMVAIEEAGCLVQAEKILRESERSYQVNELSSYWGDLVRVLIWYRRHRDKDRSPMSGQLKWSHNEYGRLIESVNV